MAPVRLGWQRRMGCPRLPGGESEAEEVGGRDEVCTSGESHQGWALPHPMLTFVAGRVLEEDYLFRMTEVTSYREARNHIFVLEGIPRAQ